MSAKPTVNPLMSSPPKDSGSLIRELWEHFYPKEFVVTLFAYFRDHRKFFDEVFSGQWQGKLKPVPFYFASFSIVLVVSLIFPFVHPFYLGEEAADLGWTNNLSNEIITTAVLVIFLMFYWFTGKVLHRFLKVTHRTQKETIYVYLYNSCAFILLAIPAGFSKSETFIKIIAEMNLMIFTAIFAVFYIAVVIYSIVKPFKVFRYTHNIGFGRWLWANTKSGLVVLTLGIPLLFMASEKTAQAKPSSQRFQGVLIGMAVVVVLFVMLYWYGTTMENSTEPAESSVSAPLEKNVDDSAMPLKPREGIPTNTRQQKSVQGAAMLEQKILGIWYFEVEEEISDPEGTMTMRGTTEYFRNGTCTSVGEIILNALTPEGEEFEAKYSFLSSGEWMIHQYALTEKLVDMKTMPEYIEMNGERYSDPEQLAQMPKFEDEIPMGISEESEIIEISRTIMRTKSRDDMGNEIIVVNYKRDKPFVLK
jgi:hypothetical protein